MPLVEVLNTSRSHATPGWAYIPDTRSNLDPALKPSAGRKRGIREPGGRTDLTSRQAAAINRHLLELDRENHRDNVSIPVPVRKDTAQRDNGRAQRAKTTSNVRKILQSQKTFKNYLDDEEAALANIAASSSLSTVPRHHHQFGAGVSKVAKLSSRRSSTPVKAAVVQEAEPKNRRGGKPRKSLTAAAKKKEAAKQAELESQQMEKATNPEDPDAMQVDGPQEPPQTEPEPIIKGLIKTPHDNDPLLKSYLPHRPSERLMALLLSEPPLTYNASRAGPSTSSKPPRFFCTICGYWGKIRCRGCGVRTCGLECYKVHEDSRCGAFF